LLRESFANQEPAMKMILKSALMAATIAGATAFFPTLASAQIGITLGIGGPGPIIAPVYAPCGPGYGPCGEGYNPYEGEYYYDPIFFDGSWYHGPYRWRMRDGVRVFWIDGGWHRNEWSGGAYPGSITFRNGGYYRGGRFEGFNDADRINARFPARNAPTRDARPEAAGDRGSMNRDHQDNGNGQHGDNQPNGQRGDSSHNDQHGDEQHNGADGPHN
jgi:hypothetical protein